MINLIICDMFFRENDDTVGEVVDEVSDNRNCKRFFLRLDLLCFNFF